MERAHAGLQEWDFLGCPGSPGAASGLPNGESRMRARRAEGRRPRGEGRVQSLAGRGAPRPRRMRREAAQSRTRLAATGWREETPDGESAKEIWPPPRTRSRERKAQEETFTGVVDWTRATIPKITSKSSDGQSHRRRPCVCGCWRLHSKDIKSERGEVQMSTTRRKHNVLWCLP